ncbi:hypothetical protein LZ30DRAFT_394756 [Colletotrichum cereale]|nr:hypothetical protein LZ30DRAFT_394756 [Colletotrichum cereale]
MLRIADISLVGRRLMFYETTMCTNQAGLVPRRRRRTQLLKECYPSCATYKHSRGKDWRLSRVPKDTPNKPVPGICRLSRYDLAIVGVETRSSSLLSGHSEPPVRWMLGCQVRPVHGHGGRRPAPRGLYTTTVCGRENCVSEWNSRDSWLWKLGFIRRNKSIVLFSLIIASYCQ